MFPQLKKLNNESGIVLFIVLMTAIVIMIFSLGILTQSMNEINYAQQQIDQITATQLSRGIFWNSYATGNMVNATYISDPINNRTYTIILTDKPYNATENTWQASVNYDTFQ